MPGFCDMHCHLREPGQEYKETIATGTRAAAAGGFTAVACMPNTVPPVDSEAAIQFILDKATAQASTDVLPIACITKGMAGGELAELGMLKAAGAVAFSDDGKPVTSARVMRMALQYAMNFHTLIISHCEEMSIAAGSMNEGRTATMLGLKGIPNAAEEIMVARDILLAEGLGARVHIAHISTRGSVALVRAAKARGVRVSAETCPHYFSATDELVGCYNTNAKVNPPLRTEDDRLAIIEGLRDGTIDAIATDHAPHHSDDKAVEFELAANGISGFETAFALSWTHLVSPGHLDAAHLVHLLAVAPRALLGQSGGVLAEGERACITLADPALRWVVRADEFLSRGRNTPFAGHELTGRIVHTLRDGKSVFKDA